MYRYELDPRIIETQEFAELPDVEKTLVVSMLRLGAEVARINTSAQIKYQSEQESEAFRSGVFYGIVFGITLVSLLIIIRQGREAEE